MGPLAGIRVLDFSSFIAGPYAAMLLGDLGADVIKVEPLSGDLARQWGPFLAGESRFFQGWNRNKRSIAIDVAATAGREVVYALVRRADVVIENFRCGVTRRLKIDYDALRALNPRLIYCTATAFGARGPQRDRPGYDPVLQSLGGVARNNTRFNGGRVAICAVPVTDYQASMLLATGVTAALYHRERTGQGQHIETSLLQAVMCLQSQSFVKALDREEEGGVGVYPYRLFDTKDDQIFIAAATDRFWRLLCDAIGEPGLARDSRYATNTARVRHAEELSPCLEARFRERTTADWEAELLAAGVPCGPVRTHHEFFEDPQVEAMGMNPVVEHSKIGRLRLAGVPIDFDKTPGTVRRAAPLLGEHTEEILNEIGWGPRIEQLRRDRLIGPQGCSSSPARGTSI